MSDNPIQITAEFDLPIGYEDQKGVLHKHVTIRRMKNGDIISMRKDIEIKTLASQMAALIDGNAASDIIAAGISSEVFNILLALVTTSIGTIQKDAITRSLFQNMHQVDVDYMIKMHNQLNGINEEAKGKDVPFAS